MGHVLLLFLTKITSFRHIPSTEKCVETDYNIYYSDSKDRDRLESYFRSNSILRLAVLFPKPQYKNGPTAGIAIALFLLLAGIIALICRKCCCVKSKSEAPQVVVVQAPAATASEK